MEKLLEVIQEILIVIQEILIAVVAGVAIYAIIQIIKRFTKTKNS